MNLSEIYQPIADDLNTVEDLLKDCLAESTDPSISAMSSLLLESPGKRIRPALVILSERAASAGRKRTCNDGRLVEIATAMELIHMASLVHDDVLDKATMRHTIPTINVEYGDDMSIILGDYVYSKAFQLMANCRNPDIFMCMSEAIGMMCEGELIHVCHRGNLDLSTTSYIAIAKKKTASLFAACCHAGTITGNHSQVIQEALKEFGLNFGVAFQIIDDCKDVLSEESELGKHPGQDMIAGDITLPILTLLEVVGPAEKEELRSMLGAGNDNKNLERLRTMLMHSNALSKINETIASYLNTAKKCLESLSDSVYKESLNRLTDYTAERAY
jgi:octaprenyl-diphosphate synthase